MSTGAVCFVAARVCIVVVDAEPSVGMMLFEVGWAEVLCCSVAVACHYGMIIRIGGLRLEVTQEIGFLRYRQSM